MAEILVIAEQRRGELIGASLECIAAAVELKQQGDQSVAVCIIAPSPEIFVEQLSAAGVDEIITIKSAQAEFQADEFESTLLSLIGQRQPALVLTAHSIDAWGYAPALAIKGGFGYASDVFAMRYENNELIAIRAGYAEKVHVEVDFPGYDTVLLTVRGNTFKPVEASGSPQVNSFEAAPVSPRSSHEEYIEPESGGEVDITQAEFMLSIGRGISEEDNVEEFAELAESMGFTLGCSRPIADNGWLPKYRQVGQSGKTVSNCSVYLALGISGSVQHMAGMKHVANIIAINTDPEASIFNIARYGVVADIFDIAEELRNHFD
ncbi:MAG: electron transfer flavoprotein subunit alpha/FixB family protein [Gammaproteobacteria bacterium]|nr:MAG: electron transfer flavoprotein subunit alpha/FixB family protein [Gammaproteobacteria bacterium]